MLMFLTGGTKDSTKDAMNFSTFSIQQTDSSNTITSPIYPTKIATSLDLERSHNDTTKTIVKSNLKQGSKTEEEEDEDEDIECSTAGNSRHGSIGEFADLRTSSQVGKKKKKRGKKSSSANTNTNTNSVSTNSISTPSATNTTSTTKPSSSISTPAKQSSGRRKKKSLSWGHVELHYFPRDFGFSAVPLSDGFPLGMSQTRIDTECAPLLQYDYLQGEYRKQKTVQPLASGKKYHQEFIHLETRKYLLKDVLSGQSTVSVALNHELASIQSSRESKGCECKHIKVDKLSVSKLKTELTLYCQEINISKESISTMTKADLSSHLREALKTCQLCKDNHCECYQAGVSCSSSGCECLRKAAKVGDCANPQGKSLFDPDMVTAFRKEKIKACKLEA